ncbi:ubiquitin-like domain-containing protein, partial [Streptomyces sp. NPDC000851]
MSNSQFEMYKPYEPYESYGPYETHEAYGTYEPSAYAGFDVHSAPTLAYGATYDTYDTCDTDDDTYRPAYERPDPVLPRQGGSRAGVGRRGGRRRRGRYAERADGSVRRLLPQALVVAFLAGGTTAFVAEDKAVELSVDGEPRRLHTFADDVTELLAEEGVEVGAHDVVTPAPGTELANGDEIAVHYGRPVRLTLDGERREVWTTARTVEGALKQLGVRAEGAYLSASRSRRIGRAGLT